MGLGFDPKAQGVERRLPKRGRNRKRPRKGGLDLTRGMENDPYCIRKKIFRVEVRHPSGASGSVDSLLEVDVEIVLFGVKRFPSKTLIKKGIRCNPQDRFHENSSTLTHR